MQRRHALARGVGCIGRLSCTQQRRVVHTQLCSTQLQISAPDQGLADQLYVQVVNTVMVNNYVNNIVNIANSNQQACCSC